VDGQRKSGTPGSRKKEHKRIVGTNRKAQHGKR
jgi:hypothetical protein